MSNVPARLVVVSCLLLACAAARAQGGPPATTIAVLPIVGDDVAAAERAALDAALRAEVEGAAVDAVQPADVTAANLASAQQVGASCAFESLSCQASLGLLTGADRVLVGRVVPEWSTDRLDLRLVDVATGTLQRETSQRLSKDAARRAVALRGAVLRLAAPERTGGFVFDADPQGTVVVDGAEVPRAPFGEPLKGLAPGPHEVEVRRGDDVVQRLVVVVVAGEIARVDGAASASSSAQAGDAPFPLGAAVLAGGAGLALVGAAGAGTVGGVLEVVPIRHDERQLVRVAGAGLLVAGVVGVVAAGVGGVLWLTEGP